MLKHAILMGLLMSKKDNIVIRLVLFDNGGTLVDLNESVYFKWAFIIKERHGRSYKLRLTQKFSEYFDVEDIKKFRQQIEPEKASDLSTETKD